MEGGVQFLTFRDDLDVGHHDPSVLCSEIASNVNSEMVVRNMVRAEAQ